MRHLLPILLALLAAPATAAPVRDLTPMDFTRLGSRPLGMGGAWTATGGDEQALFHNPAALAFEKLPRFGTSHSARHFSGPHERDQLDADPTALIWPLTPFLTGGQGWVTQGELGYAHHDLSDPAFPKQHLWGKERVDALALDLALVQGGVAHRTQSYRYADTGNDALALPTLTMEGEGTSLGLIARVLPGLRYGASTEKLDQDYMADGTAYGVTRTTDSSGWSFSPCGWITCVWQTDAPSYRTLIEGVKTKEPGTPTKRFGCEILLAPFGAVRMGSIDGHRTWGASLTLGGADLHWGQADDLMPRIVQGDWPGKYSDTHHYSWSLGL